MSADLLATLAVVAAAAGLLRWRLRREANCGACPAVQRAQRVRAACCKEVPTAQLGIGGNVRRAACNAESADPPVN